MDMLEDEQAEDAIELLQLGEVKQLLAQTIARLPEKEKPWLPFITTRVLP